jgi:hypothetical protein
MKQKPPCFFHHNQAGMREDGTSDASCTCPCCSCLCASWLEIARKIYLIGHHKNAFKGSDDELDLNLQLVLNEGAAVLGCSDDAVLAVRMSELLIVNRRKRSGAYLLLKVLPLQLSKIRTQKKRYLRYGLDLTISLHIVMNWTNISGYWSSNMMIWLAMWPIEQLRWCHRAGCWFGHCSHWWAGERNCPTGADCQSWSHNEVPDR